MKRKYGSFDDHYIPEPNSGCWLWLGTMFASGYASFFDGKKSVRAHRFSYERDNGPIPEDMVLDHKCRMKSCVNPEHLECVTQKTNMSRHFSKHYIRPTVCPAGHDKSGSNLYVAPDGRWVCRECVRGKVREYQRKKANERRRTTGSNRAREGLQ